MPRTERILAVDIGATSIKMGEFEYAGKEGVSLVGFTHREYEEELTESSRAIVVAGLLRQMLVENKFTARRSLISISGQAAFTRFVRLPPVAEEESRVRQIVEFEARQNVPFSMDEVIWDYQLIANPEAEEMDVMFVVIKNEIVEHLTNAVQAVGLDPILVDVAPAACYNAARANHVGDEDCAMILNIGGRSTNLLFADRNRFFARTIPIAGHSITQQIAKEFGIGFAEAEELKRKHGFVALGGAYAEPESEVAAAVSKIIRNVMARLHGEINRSISVYRAHQKGNRPTTLYLTGGSSTMTYTDHFFAEKLRMEVHYLNPFQVVQLGPAVNRQRLQEVAHMFSEVIGLGLRYRIPCPIEVSLVPDSIRRQQALRRKKPYVYACLACLLLILFVGLMANQRRAAIFAEMHDRLAGNVGEFDRLNAQIQSFIGETSSYQNRYDSIKTLLAERRMWPGLLNELDRLTPDSTWFVEVKPFIGELKADEEEGEGMAMMGMGPGMDPGMGMDMGMMGGEGAMYDDGPMFAPGGGGFGGRERAATGKVVQITALQLHGHSVKLDERYEILRPQNQAERTDNDAAEEPKEGEEKKQLETHAPTAELAFLNSVRASPLFDPDPRFTKIQSYIPPDAIGNLSTFTIQLKLRKPLEFYQVGGK